MKGGMQTENAGSLFCKCGKETSAIKFILCGQISIHFTKKSTYWHICKDNEQIKRVFKKPEGWS